MSYVTSKTDHFAYIYLLVCIFLVLCGCDKLIGKPDKSTMQDKHGNPVYNYRDLYSDTWVATDALGRTVPGHEKCGPLKDDKTVMIFYFLWHGTEDDEDGGPYNITEIIAANPNNPKFKPVSIFHHWAEPLFGYYVSTDQWVIRKHINMLNDAGIDAVFFDVTNGYIYNEQVEAFANVALEMKAEGQHVPLFSFTVNTDAAKTVEKLYERYYSKNLYSELWFHWQGKSLMLADINAKFKNGSSIPQKIQKYFTWRKCWAWEKPPFKHKWQWLDTHPQDYGWDKSPEIPEQMPVAVGSHPITQRGTSFHNGKQPPVDKYDLCEQTGRGLHFAEQFEYALNVDPKVIMVDGWNEWLVHKFEYSEEDTKHFDMCIDKKLEIGDCYFNDSYNQEFNRDIEPMKGGHFDNYYYQLVSYIRRYKGVRKLPVADGFETISIDGDFSEWLDIKPEYRDSAYDTKQRNHRGYGATPPYINTTGRNDIVTSKVACDRDYIYFYAETLKPMTPHTDSNWMLLLINADTNSNTGWKGYNYLVNAEVLDNSTTTLKQASIYGWTTINREIKYRVSGKKMEMKIPRLDIDQIGDNIRFDFKWADNIQEIDLDEFYLNGDVAPNSRFNYRYQNKGSGE
jgi:hypothetical protein